MKLKGYVIGKVSYFVNEDQIKEAGSIKAAAEAMAEVMNPKPSKVKEKEKAEQPKDE